MSRALKFLNSLRNNWKKSLFGAAVVSYAISYGNEINEINELMRIYSKEAMIYGARSIKPHDKTSSITVILNPVANKRKAKKLFEKYCEPLLHLAGFTVTVIQTQSENHARTLVANLNTQSDAILVAGGDGTFSDVVTGVIRKYHKNTNAIQKSPIGILPLGQTNRIADALFNGYQNLYNVRQLADATMAAIRGKTKLIDVVEVDLLEKNSEHPEEPIYSLSAIEWGPWNDAYFRKEKYWYLGPLKIYVTYLINGLKDELNWDCSSIIRYSDPCTGCSHCYQKRTEAFTNKRWWHVFIPKLQTEAHEIDYSKVQNVKCEIVHEISEPTTELHIITRNLKQSEYNEMPSVRIEIGPKSIGYKEFVVEGWQRLKGQKTKYKTVYAKDVEIHPKEVDKVDRQRMLFIDNEEFELKPVKIRLLPNTIKVFCP